ncbi:similar to Naumovozyma castellii NCAS_0E02820 hypothetical protein [Maudiozyma saulgeensis]|uniref:Uncharacterized protein n=1 Tax=Maudiozyma saulgeensis TaxID=1789683 RepID=A0A1X7R216_9SACH|nr:similar to Naumovozyma castellii NCAS_0E02820 hypothetical protein [Kazachstania saulgeensis]
MRSSTSVTLSLLASQALASSGTLDSTNEIAVDSTNNVAAVSDISAAAVSSAYNEDDETVISATNSVYQTNAIAYSVVEGTIAATASESTITNTHNSNLVQTSNVVSQAAQQYADQPSYTVVTTDEQGRTTTEYKWWVPASTATAAEQSVTDLASEDATATYSALSVTIPTTGATSSAIIDDDLSSYDATATESETSTSKWAYGPVTTVTSVDAEGNDYTSTLWWVASTTYTWAGESSVSSASADAVSASVKTIKSAYVTTSNSKRVTRTSTYETTMLNKAKQTASTNSTASVHSNSTNGIDQLSALNGLKYVALAAFLL